MSMMGTRYAQALFQCAVEQKKVKEEQKDLNLLQSLLSSSQAFKKIMHNPFLSQKIFSEIFKELAKALDLTDLTVKFMRVLAEQKRLSFLEEIIRHFKELAQRHEQIVEAYVVSATPLKEEQRERLNALLKAKLKQEIILHERLDPHVIGGLRVEVGQYVIDSTVYTSLNNLNKAMRA